MPPLYIEDYHSSVLLHSFSLNVYPVENLNLRFGNLNKMPYFLSENLTNIITLTYASQLINTSMFAEYVSECVSGSVLNIRYFSLERS